MTTQQKINSEILAREVAIAWVKSRLQKNGCLLTAKPIKTKCDGNFGRYIVTVYDDGGVYVKLEKRGTNEDPYLEADIFQGAFSSLVEYFLRTY